MGRSYRPADLHAAGAVRPLELAAQGFFWTGGEIVQHAAAGPVMRGQQYVEYWIPRELTHEWPIVMIHGGGGQGTDFLGTADGGRGLFRGVGEGLLDQDVLACVEGLERERHVRDGRGGDDDGSVGQC